MDYEKLYNRLKTEIQDQMEYWKSKEAERHSIESEVRWTEYGRLQALLIGLEKNC